MQRLLLRQLQGLLPCFHLHLLVILVILLHVLDRRECVVSSGRLHLRRGDRPLDLNVTWIRWGRDFTDRYSQMLILRGKMSCQ